MKLLVMISLRNLMRQKRRNLFLGMSISIGIMILVIASSFSHGISDIFMNKIMRWVTGHVSICFNDKGRMWGELCRDKERVLAIANEYSGEYLEVDEGIGMFVRTIGNGKTDNAVLVGVDVSSSMSEESMKEVKESFNVVEGSWEDLKRTDIDNPAIISDEKARYLNVKLNDIIRIRSRNIHGQDQAARLTVVGIMKNPNIFMQAVMFAELNKTKEILGFRPYETGVISFTLKNPEKDAVALADKLHKRFNPGLAEVHGTVMNNAKQCEASVFGYQNTEETKKLLREKLKVITGSMDKALAKDGVFISMNTAARAGLKAGDGFELEYECKFEPKTFKVKYTVAAVFEPGDFGANTVLINEDKFYDMYYENWPKDPGTYKEAFIPKPDDALYAALSPEWMLLKRTKNTDEFKKKYKEMGKNKRKVTLVDVRTMYESASDILKLEGILNLITLSAVLVLFFIILLGVVNTLRMTIRERTREIGTIRAIGMQKNDVRAIFLLETFFLTLFASCVGVALAFAAMFGLSHMTINMQDNPLGMILVDSHLYFLPTFGGVLGNVLLIIAIAVITAYFPARRAAKMSPANALRHYE